MVHRESLQRDLERQGVATLTFNDGFPFFIMQMEFDSYREVFDHCTWKITRDHRNGRCELKLRDPNYAH